jgi:hypothetical protein
MFKRRNTIYYWQGIPLHVARIGHCSAHSDNVLYTGSGVTE